MSNGIYTLANDVVYDELVALLNSLEVNVGDIPVCVIPYNQQVDKIRAEVARRPLVTLFEDGESIDRWEKFATRAWKAHTRAQQVWQSRGLPEVYRIEMHHKFCSFDGPFDQFVYVDADTLALGPLDAVYDKLQDYAWVTNDFQHVSDIKYIFDAPMEELTQVFSPETLKANIFCAGWFASRKGVFSPDRLTELLEHLAAGEANVMALWGPDQSLFNYLVLRSEIPYYNFACHEGATGSHWASQFEERDHVLYDHDRRLTYLHYMSIPASKFTRLCTGEDVEVPYRDLFLHYRYLKTPEARPKLISPSWLTRMQRTTSQFVNQKVGRLKSRLGKFK